MSIRLKLALAFVLLSMVGVLVSLWAGLAAARDAATRKVQQDLERTVQQFQSRVEEFRQLSEGSVAATLLQVQFVQALTQANSQNASLGLGDAEEDSQAMLAAHEAFARPHDTFLSASLGMLRSDTRGNVVNQLLVVFNARGRVVYNQAREAEHDQLVTGVRILDEALAGRSTTDLWSWEYASREVRGASGTVERPAMLPKDAPRTLYLVVAQPILRGNDIIAAVLTGRAVTTSLLPAAEQLADARVALMSRDGSVASTLSGAEAVVGRVMPGQPPVSLAVGGVNYLVQARAIQSGDGQPMGYAYLFRDLRREIDQYMGTLVPRIAWTGLALLGGAAVVAWLSARRMSQPLVRLEAAARQVMKGDLSVEVEPSGKDEVGRLAVAFNEMVGGLRQRDQIKGLFKRYLDPQVVEELIKHPEKASPGGERRNLTVLFSDLVGFTTISEQMSPEQLVQLLNRYFEEAVQALAAHGATFDKFIGDAIMCFWNAPLLQEDHAARACLTALQLMAVVDRLAPQFGAQGVTVFDCRIGVNTGPCIVGNIGSAQMHDYTVVGDAVNLASRLEGACKVYGTRTLASAETVMLAADAVLAREIDLVRVKGRAHPVRVYELLGPAGMKRPSHLDAFAEALGLYRERRFREAMAAFDSLRFDPPSRLFRERCARHLQTPPPEDWDGAHTLESK